jgi:uncharacterized FlaG/YvyC family protein
MSTIHATYGSLAPVAAPHAVRPALVSDESAPRPEPKRAEAAPQRASIEPTAEDLAELAESANKELQDSGVRVRIDRDEASARFVVRVLDENNELLRQFPSEDFLETAAQLEEMRGLLFEGRG